MEKSRLHIELNTITVTDESTSHSLEQAKIIQKYNFYICRYMNINKLEIRIGD